MTDINDMYEVLITYSIATEDEINLVTNINGWNEQSLLDILYVRTGYRNIEQLINECM